MGFNPKLTSRQSKAISNYMKNGFDKVKAIIDAGYATNEGNKHKVAWKIFSHPLVVKELDRRLNISEARQTKTLQEIAADLERNNKKAFEEGKLSESNKSLELLAKLQGGFKDKVELTGADGGPIEVSTSSLMEEIIAQAMEKIANKD